MNTVISLNDINKNYYVGEITISALQKVNLKIMEGEFVSIMGASGSGKSTLMNLIGCLDVASSGEYLLDGVNVSRLKADEFADIRNKKIGFVFQNFNLLPRTSALENVELPLLYDRSGILRNNTKAAREALIKVGLGDRLDHIPNQLSGGQKQRVALARALVNNPSLILADEPTGNLDSSTSLEIMELFAKLNKQGKTILIVTHEYDIAEYTKRTVFLKDGMIQWDRKIKHSDRPNQLPVNHGKRNYE
ncbi:MAG: ABC transporter ATP-binding protein [Candidatus Cloacimonetes bacterium]|nr:ABC transporter ATP-binding protein [Candidatus Cloacimonadota bacterium]